MKISSEKIIRRRADILRLLAKHGPMSIRSLEACLIPPMQRKKINLALSRMKKRGLIVTRYAKIFGSAGVYYQISPDAAHRESVSKLLDLALDKIRNQGVRNFDLLHSEACAVWHEFLSRMFPCAKVVGEKDFSVDEELGSILLACSRDRENIPDIILIIKDAEGSGKIYIAIEIERSDKTKERLIRKLRRYADETRFDGVVYICDSEIISQRLSNVYQSSVLKRSLRIKHFGLNFLMFGEISVNVRSSDLLVFNSSSENISFRSWVAELTKRSLFDRRDKYFKMGESGPPFLNA